MIKLCMQIPSISKERIKKLLTSLHNSDYETYKNQIEIKILTQGFTKEDIESEISIPNGDIKIKSIDRMFDHTKYISYMKARYLTQEIESDVKPQYVMMIDDDAYFNHESFKDIFNAIEYMDIHQNCGGVIFVGFLGYSYYKNLISPKVKGFFWTNKACLIKPDENGKIIESEVQDLYGAGEDAYVMYRIVARGEYVAQVFGQHIYTKPTKSSGDNNPNYDIATLINDPGSVYYYLNNTLLGGDMQYIRNGIGATMHLSVDHKRFTILMENHMKNKVGVSPYENERYPEFWIQSSGTLKDIANKELNFHKNLAEPLKLNNFDFKFKEKNNSNQ